MLGFTSTKSFVGLDVIESIHATALDWSDCRSPARAKRRHGQGKPQRVRRVPACYKVGGVLHIHPDMARQIREQVGAKITATAENMMLQNFRT